MPDLEYKCANFN